MHRFSIMRPRRHLTFFVAVSAFWVSLAYADQAVVPAMPNNVATTPNAITDSTVDANTLALQTNQQTLATNQTSLMSNQNTLALNQNAINSNIQSWLQDAITNEEMSSLLLDNTLYQDGYENLVDQLQYVMSNTNEVQPSAYQEQTVNVFQSASQSSTYADVKSNMMSDFASLILSGAGNANASESLWVSDVIPSIADPSNVAITNYNATIFPYMELSSDGQSFQVSSCDSSVTSSTGATQSVCTLMKNVLYTQALNNSCSGSYVANSSSSSTASSSTSTSSQATTTSSSQTSGPAYDSSIYPSGFSGGCSAAYYQSEYNGWNGWNQTLNSILALQSLCSSWDPSTVPSQYSGMTANITDSCNNYISAVNTYSPVSGQDNSSIAQDLMSDILTPMQDLVKYLRRLLVREMFDFSMQAAVSQNPDMAFYGSMYTLLGPDKYGTSSAITNATTNSSGMTSVPVDMTPAIGQDCVDLVQAGGYSVSIDCPSNSSSSGSSSGSSSSSSSSTNSSVSQQAQLAYLLLQQIGSLYPTRTVLPIPSLPKPAGASAVVMINGQLVALDSDGNVMTLNNSTSSTVPQITNDVTSITSAQSTVINSMVAANQLFQGQMDSFLKQKLFAASPLMYVYADRACQITLTGNSTTCSMTPAQLNRYAATWRLNPQVTFTDANGSSSTSATWADQLASSSSTEVSKEIASLLQDGNYMKFQLHELQTQLALIGTLPSLQLATAQAGNLKTQSAMIDKLVLDYLKGTQPGNTGSSPSSTGS